MKSLVSWFCLIAVSGLPAAFANNGVEAYRLGQYIKASEQLTTIKDTEHAPLVTYYLGRMSLYGYGNLKNNSLALRYFKKAGEKGLLEAQNIMARYALLFENNPSEALVWFKKAADSDDTQAQMYCAAAYLFGYGTKKRPDRARRYYIAAAKNGNPLAQYTLAEHFLESRNSHNRKLGGIWLTKSAEQGNAQALLTLGQLYLTGNVFAKDEKKGIELIDQAVTQNYVPAFYEKGNIIKQQGDVINAHRWYKKAAEKNYTPAQRALASLYMDKESQFYEPQNGFLWLLKAAQLKDQKARLAIAKLYAEGSVIDKNDNLAKAWREKAQKAEDVSESDIKREMITWLNQGKATTFNAAGYGLKGIFNDWHNPKALQENIYNAAPHMDTLSRKELYKPEFIMADPGKIAINEYYDALASTMNQVTVQQVKLPNYSLSPINNQLPQSVLVPDSIFKLKDTHIEKAPQISQMSQAFTSLDLLKPSKSNENKKTLFETLYHKAILGNSDAQFQIGQMFENGIAVQQNIEKAIHFYELASYQNDLRAQYNLALIYLENRDPNKREDYQKGMDLLREAAFKGNPMAQYSLAILNEYGYRNQSNKLVIHPDMNTALAMYYVAASNDYGEAQYRLAEILVRQHDDNLSVQAMAKRRNLIKRLYQEAVANNEVKAALPLAFFNAMDTDKGKQAAAFSVAKEKANQGDKHAALLLGLLYDRGIGVAPNHEQALYWYQQASNNPVSAFILGSYYSQGKGVNQDKDKGKALLQQAANTGFSYAHLNLAILKKLQGESFLPDLNAASSLGNSQAGLLLADYYLSQATGSQQMQKAREIYQNFAEKGDKNAQLKLGFMFEQGLGGDVQIDKARQLYVSAAKQNQPVAQYLLARLYQLGLLKEGVDYKQAKYWYNKAKLAYAPAAVALGFIYDTVEDDYKKAVREYNQAVMSKNTIGIYNLALIYEYGKGQAVDKKKAGGLYQKAADAGYAPAMTQLAGLLLSNAAGERAEQLALKWYQKAADQGDRDALYALGLLSETGVGVKLDDAKAIMYYQKSAEKGQANAKMALARMYQYGIGVTRSSQKAHDFYQSLAEQHNAFAQYQLASIYFAGDNGQKSPDKGMQLLEAARKNGSAQATNWLRWLKAQSKHQGSYIEPVAILPVPANIAEQSANWMYLDALNEWNRGDEIFSKNIFDRLLIKFPNYNPAKKAYEQIYCARPPSTIL